MKYSAAYFHMTTWGFMVFFFFFDTQRKSKDVIFHEKNIHKILLDLFKQ